MNDITLLKFLVKIIDNQDKILKLQQLFLDELGYKVEEKDGEIVLIEDLEDD